MFRTEYQAVTTTNDDRGFLSANDQELDDELTTAVVDGDAWLAMSGCHFFM